MDRALFRAFVPQSRWRSLDLYSVSEAWLRAREANELFSQNKIAGCQNVFPSLCIQEKSGRGWSVFVSSGRFYQGCNFFFCDTCQFCTQWGHRLVSSLCLLFSLVLVILTPIQHSVANTETIFVPRVLIGMKNNHQFINLFIIKHYQAMLISPSCLMKHNWKATTTTTTTRDSKACNLHSQSHAMILYVIVTAVSPAVVGRKLRCQKGILKTR